MKRYASPLVLAGALLWSAALQAAIITFSFPLVGTEEVPPNASPATGTALFEFDTTAHTLAVDVDFSGLLSGTVAAHIHCCAPPGVNAPVALGFTGFPGGVTNGGFDDVFDLASTSTYSGGFLGADTAAEAEARLLEAMLDGLTYFNVHTTGFPGGEIRGQLAILQVPEPASMALIAIAALAAAGMRRRRA